MHVLTDGTILLYMYFNYQHTLVMSVYIEMCDGPSTSSSMSTKSNVASGNDDNSKCKCSSLYVHVVIL